MSAKKNRLLMSSAVLFGYTTCFLFHPLMPNGIFHAYHFEFNSLSTAWVIFDGILIFCKINIS